MLLREQDNNVVCLKNKVTMSRLKQNQNIDNLILAVTVIAKSQCSLSEQDTVVLSETLERLQNLKRKKGKTNQQIREEFVKVIELLTKFFV
jgi:hypothetical protein